VLYKLSDIERDRLQQAVSAALSVPFIAGVEGYVWESIFHHVKGLPLPDPHTSKRKKSLFDAVDTQTRIGWSLKAVQHSPTVNSTFEAVIQRADVTEDKKRVELGFPKLTLDSKPNQIGRAILEHWNRKIQSDMLAQGVDKPRVAILLKSKDHRRYAFLERNYSGIAKV